MLIFNVLRLFVYSKGSYCSIGIGCNRTEIDINGQSYKNIYFAGEACDSARYQCSEGAHHTAWNVTNEIANELLHQRNDTNDCLLSEEESYEDIELIS